MFDREEQTPSFFGKRASSNTSTPLVGKPQGSVGESMFSSSLHETKHETNKVTMRTPAGFEDSVGMYETPSKSRVMSVEVAREYDDGELLPPSNSLLSGIVQQPQQAQEIRRRPIKTPSRAGPDLGAARGLDLSSPLVMNTTRSGEELGVTAAIELISVKSPWITVFGFPSGDAFTVLRHFQNFGEVHEHRSESGNWMHILYGSKVQASRALAQNGQFICVGDSKVMVGVKPCSDPTLADVAASHAYVSKSFQQTTDENYRVLQELPRAPKRATSVCKRFWSWVMDF